MSLFRKPKLPEEMVVQRLRTKRKAAAVIVSCMAETGMSFAEIDARLGKPEGFSEDYLLSLIKGTTTDLDIVSDIAFGLDVDIRFGATKIETPVERPPPNPRRKPHRTQRREP